jgi:hypothetical protein
MPYYDKKKNKPEDDTKLRSASAAPKPMRGASVPLPQWSHQNRPTVVRAKPANGRGPGLGCFTPQAPVEASLF